MKEYIIAPAAKLNDEVRISRFSHAELMGDKFFKKAEQGFITNLDKFVNREEALKLAKEGNSNLNKLCDSDDLYSEDLFLNEFKLKKENKELKYMINLMAEYIDYNSLNDDYCKIRTENCELVGGNRRCSECVKEYFINIVRNERK